MRLAADPAEIVRPSARVRNVAEMIDADPGDVRRLLAAGELEGHGKGKRGVRIFLDSVADYQTRKAIVGKARPASALPARRPRRATPASTAAHRAAVAELRRSGIG